MATPFNRPYGAFGAAVDRASVDEALRAYMLRVYNLMASGLLLSGIVAVGMAMNPEFQLTIFTSGLGMIAMFAPIAIILIMSFGANKMSAATLGILYWVFVAANGVSLSTIFLRYDLGSIVSLFFVTAATFGSVSLYGYVTKRDLTGMGSFLMMGVFGIVIASIVNMFLHSSGLSFMVSVLGVLIFTGLTAYDTQRIKSEFYAGNGPEIASKQATFGAVSLYLNFLNIFLFLLQLFGNNRN